MHHADSPDAMLAVLLQYMADGGRIGTTAPVGLQRQHIEAQAQRHLFPEVGELAGAADQDAVPVR